MVLMRLFLIVNLRSLQGPENDLKYFLSQLVAMPLEVWYSNQGYYSTLLNASNSLRNLQARSLRAHKAVDTIIGGIID